MLTREEREERLRLDLLHARNVRAAADHEFRIASQVRFGSGDPTPRRAMSDVEWSAFLAREQATALRVELKQRAADLAPREARPVVSSLRHQGSAGVRVAGVKARIHPMFQDHFDGSIPWPETGPRRSR